MISTKRCILRNFKEKDLDTVMVYRNNDGWMKYQSFKNLTKEAYRKVLLATPNIINGIQYAIVNKATDELIGDVYLIKKAKTLTIGYTINPVHARKGYVFEVIEALLIELKLAYDDCEIVAMTDKENIASINLLFKLGFVYDAWIEKWQSEVYLYKG